MNAIGVIPARMGSSRFPGKPLAPILGMSMIEHVYRRTKMCQKLSEVIVATCDQEIIDVVERFGGKAVMTSSAHERASDRVAELAESIPADIYVMVQGDEPLIHPDLIALALRPFSEDAEVMCVNLAAPIRSEEDFEDRNTIKVVMNIKGDALFMSREPIPTRKLMPFSELEVFKQVCVIPFRRDFLMMYTKLTPTPLERAESVDMLRLLEHGYQVRLVPTDGLTQAVDTLEDLHKVEKLLATDSLWKIYGSGR